MNKWPFPIATSLLLLLLIGLINPLCAKTSYPKLVLSSIEGSLKNQTDAFDCAGRIHGYLSLKNPLAGQHKMDVTWRNPLGQDIEHSTINLNFEKPRRTAYVWLNFEEEKKGGLLSPTESESVYTTPDDHPYTGQWEVEIKIDGNFLIKSHFNVSCIS